MASGGSSSDLLKSSNTSDLATFVSYSRHDFNFAESLTATLRRCGVTTAWIDVENLRAGTDWATCIDSALACAQSLTLVASKSAVSSKYVATEWRTALRRGIPIYLVLIERVRLPAELASCPVYDLRARFWSGCHRLARDIESQTPPVSSPGTGAAVRLPLSVAAVLLTIALEVLSLLIAADWWRPLVPRADDSGVSLGRTLWLGVASLVGLAVIVARYGMLLIKRRIRPGLLLPGLLMGAFSYWVMASVLLYLTSEKADRVLAASSPSRVVVPFTWCVPIGVCLLGTAALSMLLVSRSRTVYLWMPTGDGYHHVRQRILGRKLTRERRTLVFRPAFETQWRSYQQRLQQDVAVKADVLTYRIAYDKADAKLAAIIDDACKDAGLTPADANPLWQIVVVTGALEWKQLQKALSGDAQHGVCVLAASVSVPLDAWEMRRYQWIDFRDQSPEGLFNFLQALVSGTGAGDATPVVPATPGRFKSPLVVRGVVESCQMYATVVAAVSLGFVVFRPGHWWGAVAVLGVVAAMLLLVLADRVAGRRLDATGYVSVSLAITIGIAAWTACIVATLAATYPVAFAFSSPPFHIMVFSAIPGFCGGLLVALPGLLLRAYRQLDRYWMPAKGLYIPATVKPVTAKLNALLALTIFVACSTGGLAVLSAVASGTVMVHLSVPFTGESTVVTMSIEGVLTFKITASSDDPSPERDIALPPGPLGYELSVRAWGDQLYSGKGVILAAKGASYEICTSFISKTGNYTLFNLARLCRKCETCT